ncbi:MAG: hypothetical protein ACOH16_12115 [Propionibacteriaceae bacterium]
MTIHLIQQIELAERLTPSWSDPTSDPRFAPSAHTAVRDLSARLIRSSAELGLRMADKLDRDHVYA